MGTRYIDLTIPITDGMSHFPSSWHPAIEVSQMGTYEGVGRKTSKIVIGSHGGTHLDAPLHFLPNGDGVDKIPLEKLTGSATLVDFSNSKPSQEFGVADFEKEFAGKKPERIVINYGWAKFFGQKEYFSGHPFMSEDAARWLIDSGVSLIAIDTPNPDNPKNGKGSALDSPIHKILFSSKVIVVENLTNLEGLSKKEFELIVLPLKIVNGDGSPVRCIAIEE